MKATCWYGKSDVRVEEVSDPKILNPRDAIVKITSTAICGSDLHLYDGFIPTMEKGDILGHEFMGEVVELGSEVKNLNIGDRVVVPFPIACGNSSPASGNFLLLRKLHPKRCHGGRAVGPGAGRHLRLFILTRRLRGRARVPFADVGR